MGRHRIIAIFDPSALSRMRQISPIHMLFLCVPITCLDIPLYQFFQIRVSLRWYSWRCYRKKEIVLKVRFRSFSHPKKFCEFSPRLYWINVMIPSRLSIHIEQWTLRAGNGETEYRGMSDDSSQHIFSDGQW